MLISRKVNDPRWPLQPNRLGRTTGFYGHTPKYWSCKGREFPPNYAFWGNDPVQAEESAARERAAHKDCKIKRHRSAVGYLCYVGKKRYYTFWYMGNPFRHKLIEIARKDKEWIAWNAA